MIALDPGDVFATRAEAAYDALDYINPTSVAENAEYSGTIEPAAGGGYYATEPQRGTHRSVPITLKATTEGDYHTHGDYSTQSGQRTSRSRDQFDSERFSPDDRSNSRTGANLGGRNPEYRSYLGTPSGNFRVFDPNTGRSSAFTKPAFVPMLPTPSPPFLSE